MENLAQIETVKQKIKVASTAAIRALHRFIFEEEGDRRNRKRLRDFQGFTFADNSQNYIRKVEYARRLTIGDLISCCNILGLKYDGSKEEIIERICAGLMNLNELISQDIEEDEEEPGEEEAETEEVRPVETRAEARNGGNMQVKFSMTYRDVEGSIKPFNGKDAYPIEKWITDFEDTATLFGWTELQRVVFAKKSLAGPAKLLIESEGVMRTWQQFKAVLTKEFSDKVNSAELHEMLRKRKLTRDETVQEYYLTMKEMASRGKIEPEALIQHVIDGISDDSSNKLVLYGTKTLEDFKERIKTYEAIRKKNVEKTKSDREKETSSKKKEAIRKQATFKKTEEKVQDPATRCYNCGARGHLSKDCKKKELGKKCFRCQKFGHTAAQCDLAEESKTEKKQVNVNTICAPQANKMFKEVSIKGKRLDALIDTGSQVTIMREDIYNDFKLGQLLDTNIWLTGFGKNEVRSLGCFQTIIEIDSEQFPCLMHVVRSDAMNSSVIIGSDILNLAEVIINIDGITIRKASPTMFLAQINVLGERSLNIDAVDPKIREEVETLVEMYKPEKCKTTDVEMRIVLKDNKPIFQKPRRLPAPEREIVEQQIEEWISEGIVEACTSEYASAVVVVKKKDGRSRVCIDYRKLNRVVEKDGYPMPLIEDVLDKLADARVFSTLDLRNGFFHVPIEEGSRKYTAFVTHSGQYQFLRTPFGLCNSPRVFQRFVNAAFWELIRRNIVLLYLDDLIVPARNEQEAVERLKLILRTASEYGLQLNLKKCQFIKRSVEFLGHIVEGGKIYPSPEKVKAVINYPEPKGLKDIQSFLGLSGYFRKFIPLYSVIARPLSDLLQKNRPYNFDENARSAFQQLKTKLTQNPVLKIYNPKHVTEVHTDASIDGYGAVMMQRSPDDNLLHPVYFMSKKTKPAERNYSSYELEVLAVIEAVKKFRIYLLGTKFKILTDCAAFQRTMDKKDLTTRVARWALLLEDYDYSIEHRPGVRMKHVDALSRHPIMTISTCFVVPQIKKQQERDDETKALIEVLKNKESYDNYFMRGDLLYKFKDGRNLLVVPKSLETDIIQAIHEKGHFATARTEEIIRQEYYIKNLKDKVEQYIASCVPCILTRRKEGKQEGYLHPIPKPDVPLHTYHADHLGPLDTTCKSYKYILAIVDSFTKFAWLYPTKSTTTREVISKLELQRQVFGNPVQIITDRGTAFTSQEFSDYCKTAEIKHVKVTTGLPRANGQVERLNRTIIAVLSKLSIEDPTKWYKYVDELQRILNSAFHRSIATTPFELLFGVKMRNEKDLKLRQIIEQEFQAQFENERDQVRVKAKEQISKIQSENCKTYNLRRRPSRKYVVGDLVAIKRTQFGPGRKLQAKYLGPYSIKKVKPNDTYDVSRFGDHEGPAFTSTCAEYLKPWPECKFNQ